MATEFPVGIRPHGAGLEIRVQYQGQGYSQTLQCSNPSSDTSITRAVRARNELRRRLRRGSAETPPEADGSIRFAVAAQGFIDAADVEYSTITAYLSIMQCHWIPVFGDWPLRDIRPSQIKAYIHGLTVTPKTKRNLLVPLRGVYHWAIEEGLINTSPVLQVRSKKAQKPQIEVFTNQERDAILGRLGDQAFVYFALLFGTGIRPSEALALRWTNISDSGIYISSAVVRGRLKHSTKTHQSRMVHIEPWLLQVLREHTTRFSGEWVFTKDGGGHFTNTRYFNDRWRKALAQARVRYRIPYTCRHTRASEMLTRGVKPPFAALQLGHTLEMFFRTYAVWITEQDDQAEISKLKTSWEKHGVTR